SDMWAIGCLLYCLLYYEYPPISIEMILLEDLINKQNKTNDVTDQQIVEHIRKITKIIPEMPASLIKNVELSNMELVILSLLQPSPKLRMTSAEMLNYMNKIAAKRGLA
ncbi:MAG: hypothetical protein ACREGC_03805, partial [Minisyncoccia bacterium]